MRRHLCVVAALVAILTVGPASAELGLELTPTIGYRWGGEISAGATDLWAVDMEVDEGDSWGLTLGIDLGESFQLELMTDFQSTELGENGFLAPHGQGVEVDIDYYHVGFVWHWQAGRARPFVVASLGITSIEPDIAGIDGDDEFSAGLGGGVTIAIAPHLGVRFEVRGLWTDTADNDWWDDDWDDDDWWDDCDDHHDCDDWGGWDDLVQGQARVGLVVSF